MVCTRKPKRLGDHRRWEADFDYRVSSRAVLGVVSKRLEV